MNERDGTHTTRHEIGGCRTCLAFAMVAALLLGVPALDSPAVAETALLNVSYDPTRELYRDINAAFAEVWKARTGEAVTVRAAHGGSGAQARTVIDGIPADVVTLGIPSDIDAIARLSKKISPDWRSRLPNDALPYTSTVVFLVRKGNPMGIKDWGDIAKPDVKVITPNPKTSAGGRWNFLAAWGYAFEKEGKDKAKADAFVGALYRQVPVLDTGARGSTTASASSFSPNRPATCDRSGPVAPPSLPNRWHTTHRAAA